MRHKDEDKRGRIIAAASPLFARKHFHEVTLDEVAELAKVGKGSIYTYFQDKDGLYSAVIIELVETLMTELERQIAAAPDPRSQLRSAALGCIRFLQSTPHAMPLFQRAETREIAEGAASGILAARRRSVTTISALIQTANRSGQFRVGHPDLAAAMFFGMIRAAFLYPPPGFSAESLADGITDLFLNGAAAQRQS